MRKHHVGALKLKSDYVQPHSLDSSIFFLLHLWMPRASNLKKIKQNKTKKKNRNQQPYKHDNQNILFRQNHVS